ncbi:MULTISPECIES: SusC/RagA family TonB-linked outer membrane protein [Chitinophaga]|uniref:SusC/RagA family TonB-linked outer membrane protein n=1 Tax=Chitinophaga TaxID=79328 RepID=UPI000DB95189|nr:TonB-dependent receptor [Chitinophaga ginsengisegetis]MDR6567341.1 TonB-linked SusC/RagA family outer membrane protein [Chitinophaga ginsengisegetis]MDR6647072.1 TonB-linked SusC/RagA family outer membrane protein [Chitinophaga ginsengisegetis]MDR6653421.1 TonB-linked SusC/RagA family outer membrane protein [Chitinophaga ginsengisegetis]
MKKRLRFRNSIRKVIPGGYCRLFTVLLLSLGLMAHAAPADMVITGKVTDDKGIPLVGVTVNVKGTNKGTATDGAGNYSLSVPENGAVLVFSYVGFLKQEVPLSGKKVVNVQLETDSKGLGEVVVVGYGTQKKESITGAISGVTSKDLERVHASTVSATLAGKIPGVSFRMPDGRPGAGANIQIRNFGNALYVIDGIQKDAGQFNNISPNDIESITVLKDASAAIYGVRAANGVVVVTTKRGKMGAGNTINVDAYTGWQNWSRFPKTVNAYEWMLGKADAEMNDENPHTDITREELEKWKAGTEKGYKSFDWYDFIIKKNAPQNSINVNATGGSENINYYLSLTRLDQKSVLGREFDFNRTNIQSNVDAKVAKRVKVGVQINGRIEQRDNPGVPGGDDYWAPRFALFRNRPTERPYANDNPLYPNDIGHNTENWAVQTKDISGYWTEDWRVLQTNFNATYETPIKGLTLKGMYSYYFADKLMNGHEYTYDTYTYQEATDTYLRTGGSSNPWRERGNHKVLENVLQGQINYNNTFGKHTIGATLVSERIKRRELDVWVHAVPKSNELPLIQFSDMDTYNDNDWTEARVGYIGRLNYSFSDKYFLEVAGRYDGSWKFTPDKRWGFFPSISGGWRITEEPFVKNWLGGNSILTELKLRASYGELGDDDIGIGAYDYLPGYTYGTSTVILDGTVIRGSRDKGVPNDRLSWFTSKIADVGLDYQLWNGKISGSLDFFNRKRSGLRGRKYDVLVPSEIGYNLPDENVNSDSQRGGEFSAAYNGQAGKVNFVIGGNVSYSRSRFLESYKPVWGNSWDHYRNSIEDRWNNIYWGYEAIGQFQSQEEINKYPVNVDGQGNKTLLPGDIIYKDMNGDNVINDYDQRPIGYQTTGNPTVNFGLNFGVRWNGIDFTADFSGGSMYSYNQNWEMRWPYQNGGNLLKQFYDDRWHREDPFDLNSKWIPGKNPPLRFNKGGHSNYNKPSTFWLHNVHYLRLRTMEIGYSIPQQILDRIRFKKVRVYVNTYNLFSLDNVKDLGIEPEIADENGLQYPQNKLVNIGLNFTF